MDSFKRNIILFTTFNIVILCMITLANAELITDPCLEELDTDKFTIKVGYYQKNIEHAAKYPLDYFKTFYGGAFRRKLCEDVVIQPPEFCLWIINSNNDPKINSCKMELEEDNFNTNTQMKYADIYHINWEIAHSDIDPKTVHGKIYRSKLRKNGDFMVPIYFCLWIHDSRDELGHVNVARSQEWENLNYKVQFELCMTQLDSNGFKSTAKWTTNAKIARQHPPEWFTSTESQTYRDLLLIANTKKYKEYRQTAREFCIKFISNKLAV